MFHSRNVCELVRIQIFVIQPLQKKRRGQRLGCPKLGSTDGRPVASDGGGRRAPMPRGGPRARPRPRRVSLRGAEVRGRGVGRRVRADGRRAHRRAPVQTRGGHARHAGRGG